MCVIFLYVVDYDCVMFWVGLWLVMFSSVFIVGVSGVLGLWLNIGYGLLGFIFFFVIVNIVVELVSGCVSLLLLEGLGF